MLRKWPAEMNSSATGELPCVRNCRPPPGAKKPLIDTLSSTRSLPKLTTPSASPASVTLDLDGQALGPVTASAVGEQVANPCVSILLPAGVKKLMPMSGGGKPPYSVPAIL